MDDALQLLHAPLGAPGSGRVRYGAAMELFHRGLISEAQLDVYREASPFDARDPAPLLAERGLPPVAALAATPAAAMKALFIAARDHVSGLSHAGAAEVRMALSRCLPRAAPPPARPHPVADRWLPAALEAASSHHPQLAAAIAAAAPHLAWVSYDAYPLAEIGESFANGHAFAAIAGSEAAYAADNFELGLFLIAPHVLYRDRCHPAPELYAPLTGPHGWRFGPGRPVFLKPAGEPVWNPSLRPHLTKVGAQPFLCLFAWTDRVGEPARVLPAADWAALEAMTLG